NFIECSTDAPFLQIGEHKYGKPILDWAVKYTTDLYVTLSPIYATASKPGYGPALGLEGLTDSLGAGLPVVALGGLGPGAVRPCRAAGAAGFAIMGGLMRAADPIEVTRALLKAWGATKISATP
ncbi:thiamine phosphate synthase, partial [Methylobacterium organophilum]|nr:thiamine phosphate synthase [Methylobacterium organophilum]